MRVLFSFFLFLRRNRTRRRITGETVSPTPMKKQLMARPPCSVSFFARTFRAFFLFIKTRRFFFYISFSFFSGKTLNPKNQPNNLVLVIVQKWKPNLNVASKTYKCKNPECMKKYPWSWVAHGIWVRLRRYSTRRKRSRCSSSLRVI